MKDQIGLNAGTIWSYLSEEGEKGLKEIKKTCKLTEKETHTAIGWLAREGKIELETLKDDVKVTLNA